MGAVTAGWQPLLYTGVHWLVENLVFVGACRICGTRCRNARNC